MRTHPHARRDCRGITLVELLIVMTIVTVALGEVTRSMITISKLEPMSREADFALQAAATQLDTMRAMPFASLVARYNDEPADDPDGPGTAPGSAFPVGGLRVRPGDGDGMTGRVEFPSVGAEIREDVVDVELGMPRDLNLDGVTDGLDHAGDYGILPVRILIEWNGEGRDRQLELMTTLTGGG